MADTKTPRQAALEATVARLNADPDIKALAEVIKAMPYGAITDGLARLLTEGKTKRQIVDAYELAFLLDFAQRRAYRPYDAAKVASNLRKHAGNHVNNAASKLVATLVAIAK
jgi:hypothetical protein